jgi:hypothetical protein
MEVAMTEDQTQATDEFDEKTLEDAEYCRSKCPMCRPARWRGMGFLRWILKKVEANCEKCVAYEKVYGVKAWEKPTQ